MTKEQLARLKEMDERREKMIRESRKHRNDSTGRPGMRPGNRDGRPFFDDRRMPPRERHQGAAPDSLGSPDNE